MRHAFHAVWFRWGRFHALVNDALNRVRIIKAFSQQTSEISRYSERNTELMNVGMYADQMWATLSPLVWFLMGVGSYLVWYFGGWMRVHDARFTPGELMAFLGYLGLLFGPMSFLTQLVQWMTRALTAAERIFEVLDAESDQEGAEGGVVPETLRGEIEFRNVTFGYKARPAGAQGSLLHGSSRGRCWAWSARAARARPPSSTSSAVSTKPTRARFS